MRQWLGSLVHAACAGLDRSDKGLDWSDIQSADGAIAFPEDSRAKRIDLFLPALNQIPAYGD